MIAPRLRGCRALSLLTLFLATALLRAEDLAPAPSLPDGERSRINATAHGLAGLTSDDAPWQGTGEWNSYRDWLDGRWRYIERVRLGAMRSWGGSELGGLGGGTVYYPFSGPDFLYVNTLFPGARTLLMAGLEPIGSIPDLAEIQRRGELGNYLGHVKTSLYTILAASFFKTKDMRNDFGAGSMDGLLPALEVFIARQGYTIDGLQYVSLSSDGSLHPRDSKSGANGIEITYSGGHTLCYFQVNLADDGSGGYERLMQRTAPGVTYLKAASYLLYNDYFSRIRNAILDDSTAVVEDDSGMPFRYFKPAQWNVTAYGNYTGPIPLFKENYQPDLANYYRSNGHSALPFGSGYKFVASGSSLLVARRK
jgi:hypothetical protein